MQAFGDYHVLAHHEFPEVSLRVLRMEEGQEIPAHYHNVTSQSYLVLEGAIEVRVGDVTRRITGTDAVRVPAGQIHSVRPVDGPATVISASIPPLKADDHFNASSS